MADTQKIAVVEYTGTLEDGSVFDTTEGKDPIEFPLGAGAVIKGFEETISSMKVGEEKEIDLAPDQAYGDRNDKLKQDVPKDQIPEQIDPKVGTVLALKAPNGMTVPARITAVDDAKVTIDLNHPLAGKKLHFKLKLKELKDAPAEPEKRPETQEKQ